jgi:hypothetical protein
MPSQTYANHAHRPTATVIAAVFWVVAVVGFVQFHRAAGIPNPLAMGLAGLMLAVLVLISITRTYITKLQDRIIRLEMRVRTASLLTPQQAHAVMALDVKRIAALRFASDAELPDLVDRAVRESLTPDQIKRAVKVWVPDLDRT